MKQLAAVRGNKHLTSIVYKTSIETGISCAPLVHRYDMHRPGCSHLPRAKLTSATRETKIRAEQSNFTAV